MAMETTPASPLPGPSGASSSLSPVKKRPPKPMGSTEKLMVMNAHKQTYKKWNESEAWSLLGCAKKTADLLGISVKTMLRIVKENKINPTFASPKKRGPKRNIISELDEFTFSAIRKIVHQFNRRKELPTLAKITKARDEDTDLPSISSVQKVLHHLKFKYQGRKRNCCLIDRDDIKLWRQNYLRYIKQYRRDGKFIYYQDVTWLNEGHTVQKTWVDAEVKSSNDAFLEGLTTGLKAPTGKGRRLIISYIGSEESFLEDGLMMFESKRNTEDYHKEMNSECFEQWLISTILPKLKPNSMLVLDNAPYHSRKIEKIPNMSWMKNDIKTWLDEKEIENC